MQKQEEEYTVNPPFHLSAVIYLHELGYYVELCACDSNFRMCWQFKIQEANTYYTARNLLSMLISLPY